MKFARKDRAEIVLRKNNNFLCDVGRKILLLTEDLHKPLII